MKTLSSADRLAPIGGINDRYLAVLLLLLLGYALFGRGFAYAGLPPLFIGEIVLALGLLALLHSGCFVAAMASLPSVALAALILWVLARTVPYIQEFGVDALRDSVIAMYGLFAFVIIGLLVQRRERLLFLIVSYGRFVFLFTLIMPFLYLAYKLLGANIPVWPHSGTPILFLRPGELAVHLAGITLFIILGFQRFNAFWTLMLLLGIIVVVSHSRGGMLSILLPVGLALMLVPFNRQIGYLGILASILLVVALALDVGIHLEGSRSVSARQIIANLMSIFSSAGSEQLQGTKEWRLRWWGEVVRYTIGGEYFWTGKGFGVNLADVDGFQVIGEGDAPALRSPHNAHMTFLARGGVPGLILWTGVCLSWVIMLLQVHFRSRQRGDRAWSRLFLFLLCYWLALLTDASFDVALEGPMIGIWFWFLYGTGVGAAMIYRHEDGQRLVSAWREEHQRWQGRDGREARTL